MTDLSIVIPCYNEADSLAKLQNELRPVAEELAGRSSLEIVFVDDGSTDATWEVLHATYGRLSRDGVAFRFVQHEANRGLGAALRTGFGAARGQTIVTTDCDGTYRFSQIPALLACLTPEFDIVTASPYHRAGGVAGVPPYRLVLSRGSSIIYRLLVNRHIHTYTALFRAYRRPVIERIPFESNGFLAGTELLVKAMLAGYRVTEYPTVLYARAYGVSKAKLARTIRAHLRFQARILGHLLGLWPFSGTGVVSRT